MRVELHYEARAGGLVVDTDNDGNGIGDRLSVKVKSAEPPRPHVATSVSEWTGN